MKHIKELDGLRGLLAFWVFASHSIELGPYAVWGPKLQAHLAVDVFIILSGFVIFHLLRSGASYRTFITRRWFRLFPVFAVCFSLALILYKSLGIHDETAFGMGLVRDLKPYVLAHATMLHGAVPEQWLPYSARAILVPAWSVSLEWQFYLVAPLLYAFATRPNWKVTAVFATLVAARIVHDAARHGLFGGAALTFDMHAFLPLRLEFFAVGAGSYGIWRWLSERGRAFEIPRLWYALLLPVLILLARKSPAVALWLSIVLVLSHAHFGIGNVFTTSLSSFLNSAACQFLGRISYCIYLFHLPALIIVRQALQSSGLHLSQPVWQVTFIVTGLIVTTVGSWVIHVLIEKPMIQLGRRLTKSSSASVPASAPVETVSTT